MRSATDEHGGPKLPANTHNPEGEATNARGIIWEGSVTAGAPKEPSMHPKSQTAEFSSEPSREETRFKQQLLRPMPQRDLIFLKRTDHISNNLADAKGGTAKSRSQSTGTFYDSL